MLWNRKLVFKVPFSAEREDNNWPPADVCGSEMAVENKALDTTLERRGRGVNTEAKFSAEITKDDDRGAAIRDPRVRVVCLPIHRGRLIIWSSFPKVDCVGSRKEMGRKIGTARKKDFNVNHWNRQLDPNQFAID